MFHKDSGVSVINKQVTLSRNFYINTVAMFYFFNKHLSITIRVSLWLFTNARMENVNFIAMKGIVSISALWDNDTVSLPFHLDR